MGSKLFLDANVLLDAYLPTRTGHVHSARLLRQVSRRHLDGFVTPAVLHIASYFLKKERPVDWIKSVFVSMLDYVRVIDASHTISLSAIQSHFTDIEDALQYFTALHYGCDIFISSDKGLRNAALPHLPVVSAETFFLQQL